MNDSHQNNTLQNLKSQAKRLRASLQLDGQSISHSKSLELVAHQMGFRDWNTLFASHGNCPPVAPVHMGQDVFGHYMGQPFSAKVLGLEEKSTGRYRLTLKFDDPLNVTPEFSFEVTRQRVSCNIDISGKTIEKTSNGEPHLSLAL